MPKRIYTASNFKRAITAFVVGRMTHVLSNLILTLWVVRLLPV